MKKTQEENEAVQVLGREITAILPKKEVIITDDKSMAKAVEVLSTINKYADNVKAEKEKITKPASLVLKNAREMFAPLEERLANAIGLIRGAMSSYQTQLKREADRKAEDIGSRIKPGKGNLSFDKGIEKIDAIEKPIAKVETASGAVKFRTDIKVNITEIAAMNEAQLLSLQNQILIFAQEGLVVWNESAVRALIKEKKSNDLLPGVTFEEVQTVINSR